MGLIITPVNEYTDAGEFRGILQDIACGCWFTVRGKVILQPQGKEFFT